MKVDCAIIHMLDYRILQGQYNGTIIRDISDRRIVPVCESMSVEFSSGWISVKIRGDGVGSVDAIGGIRGGL